MTSTRSLEITGLSRAALTDDRLHRGRNVSLAFLMQGWGQLVNQVLLIILLIISNPSRGNAPFTKTATQWTFRLQFAFVGLLTLWLVYYRVYKVKGADDALTKVKRRAGLGDSTGAGGVGDVDGEKGPGAAHAVAAAPVRAYDKKSLQLTTSFFWHRLIGTAGGWFCNDFFFYGNKIFSGVFIKIIHPEGTVMTTWLYNLMCVPFPFSPTILACGRDTDGGDWLYWIVTSQCLYADTTSPHSSLTTSSMVVRGCRALGSSLMCVSPSPLPPHLHRF